MGAVGTAKSDEWFLMGEQSIRNNSYLAEIRTEGVRSKRDIKQVKLEVGGAHVELIKVVFEWYGGEGPNTDTTLRNLYVRNGQQTAPTNAPGRKGSYRGLLLSVKFQDKIQVNERAAIVRILGCPA